MNDAITYKKIIDLELTDDIIVKLISKVGDNSAKDLISMIDANLDGGMITNVVDNLSGDGIS